MNNPVEEWMKAEGWIQTYRGLPFWPLAPKAEDVHIQDIAHALSLKCRFGGHCHQFYSVAQHSVLVSQYVPRKHQLWGLLHDASEAYLPDVCRPVKPLLTNFKEVEANVMAAVCRHFKMPKTEPKSVKRIDTLMLYDEMKVLMPTKETRPWLRDGVGVVVRPWPWKKAKREFLKRFYELT